MLNLKQQVFGSAGYTADLQLSPFELQIFRESINEHWLDSIKNFHPELADEAEKLGIQNYHKISAKVDHKKLWPKHHRVLPQQVVEKIKQLPFLSTLKAEFGEFKISDVVDVKQHHGREEIYWRLVRPHAESDVGPLHKDTWFHGAYNSGYGMFAEDEMTVKIWAPIFCEAGKSGLSILPGSHLKEWKYHIETSDDGYIRPVPDEDLSQLGASLIPTEPGNLLIFNEKVLHGGVVNKSELTRVSAEITMVFKKEMVG